MLGFRYLYRNRSGVLFYRYQLPASAAAVFGRREVKKSLRTESKAVALPAALSLHSSVTSLVEMAKEMAQFSNFEDLRETLQEEFTLEMQKNFAKIDKMLRGHEGLSVLEEWKKKHGGVALDPFNEKWRDVWDFLQQTRLDSQSASPAPLSAPAAQVPCAPPAPAVEVVPPPSRVPISEVVERYRDEMMIDDNGWTIKTADENAAIYRLLVEFLHDMSIDVVSYNDARMFKDMLIHLPPNRNKSPKFRGLSLQQILKMNTTGKGLAVNSINKYLRRVSQLFKWAVLNGYCSTDFFSGLSIKVSKAPIEERPCFSKDDLRNIFAPEYFNLKALKEYQYWGTLLALFTGCRANEVAQLYCDDISQKVSEWGDGESVSVINVNDRAADKNTKSNSSRRIVPIHSVLLGLGFLDFVEEKRKAGEQRLFPRLKYSEKNHYQGAFTNWFGRYRKKVGVKPTLHSMRHTFINHLKQLGCDVCAVEQLAGHADSSMTTGRYGERYDVHITAPIVEKLPYAELFEGWEPYRAA